MNLLTGSNSTDTDTKTADSCICITNGTIIIPANCNYNLPKYSEPKSDKSEIQAQLHPSGKNESEGVCFHPKPNI